MERKTMPISSMYGAKPDDKHFRDFALFLLKEGMSQLAHEQLETARQLPFSPLQHFQHYSEAEIRALSQKVMYEFLEAIATGKQEDYVNRKIGEWGKDQLLLGRSNISADEIVQFSYIRKKALINLVPAYTSDLSIAMQLVHEIEEYFLMIEREGLKLYGEFREQQINDQLHFIEKITNTIPAFIYVYDIVTGKIEYRNERLIQVIESDKSSAGSSGIEQLQKVVHPEDLPIVTAHILGLGSLVEGEIREVECRIRQVNGQYRWMKSYHYSFKRTSVHRVRQIIGISFDVENEKQTSQQLVYREGQLLEAQELASIGSFEWDLNTDSADYTSQLGKILGISSSESFSRFIENVHPGDQQKLLKALDNARSGAGHYDLEFRYLDGDLEKVVWSRGITIYENGSPVALKGTVMDVTERHHIIKRLERSQELYKQAEEMARLGNWTWDIIHDRIEWTDQLYRIFGLEPQSRPIDFDFVQTMVHPEDREERLTRIHRAVANQEPYELYYRALLKDGTEKVLHGKGEVFRGPNGLPYKMLGTVQDVTEQKKVQKQLFENQLFIAKIADSIPAIIVSINIHTQQFSFINLGIKKLLGYEKEEIAAGGGHFVVSLIHPDDQAGVVETMLQAIAQANLDPSYNDVEELQFRVLDKSGRYVWMHAFSTVFNRNQQGAVEEILNISFDVTERIEAEQQIRQRTLELQQSNASLEEFAHVASHDLKEPLRKISTFGDRLVKSLGDTVPEDQRSFLNKIIDSTLRMQKLIDDLLSLSVISADKSFERYSLATILEEVLSSLEFKIEEKNAMIRSDLKHEVMMVPSQMRQLFQNLVSNSLKFSSPEREPLIRIESKTRKPHEIDSVGLKKASRYVEISIIDNGIGFNEEFADKIFAIFQRLHPKSRFEGTGIGLAICKKIVENHGGVIFAKSEENEGTEFTVVLPD